MVDGIAPASLDLVDIPGNPPADSSRPVAACLGYETEAVDALPDRAVESFAGVGNPFSLRRLAPGERVVDVGSGAGFDSFIAAGLACAGRGHHWLVRGPKHGQARTATREREPAMHGTGEGAAGDRWTGSVEREGRHDYGA